MNLPRYKSVVLGTRRGNLLINDVDMAGQCPAEHGNCSMPLPAPIDGYHCFEATAGDFPWANPY